LAWVSSKILVLHCKARAKCLIKGDPTFWRCQEAPAGVVGSHFRMVQIASLIRNSSMALRTSASCGELSAPPDIATRQLAAREH
jgi:hypothetical protein